MNKNEKKDLIKIVKNLRDNCDGDYFEGICEVIDTIQKYKPKEINLEHYKNEINENFERLRKVNTYDCAFTAAIQSVYYNNVDTTPTNIMNILNWLCKPYEKYKVSKMEYDLLKVWRKNVCIDMDTLDGLKNFGYFKDVDFKFESLDEILEKCEVIDG